MSDLFYTVPCHYQNFLNVCDFILVMLLAQILHLSLHRSTSVFMNAWALGAPPSQVSRRRRTSEQKGDADTAKLLRLVRVVAKLCLKNRLEIREPQAATPVTYVVPKENELVHATVDATKAYADSVAEANKITAERESPVQTGAGGYSTCTPSGSCGPVSSCNKFLDRRRTCTGSYTHRCNFETRTGHRDHLRVHVQETLRQAANQDALCCCRVSQSRSCPRRESPHIDRCQEEEGTTTACWT